MVSHPTAYGVAGVYIELKRVDKDVITRNWGPSIEKVCEICKDFIADRRKKSDQGYWSALAWLNEDSEEGVSKAHADRILSPWFLTKMAQAETSSQSHSRPTRVVITAGGALARASQRLEQRVRSQTSSRANSAQPRTR